MDRAPLSFLSLLNDGRFRFLFLALTLVLLTGFIAQLPIADQDLATVEAQAVSTSTPTASPTRSPTVTPTLPPRISVVKACGPLGSSGQYPPGSTLPCTISVNLPSALDGLALQDIIGGGGRSENTSIVGPVLLDGTTDLGSPTPTVDQYNRVVYDFPLGALPALSAGTHTIRYGWRLSDLGCYRNTTNDVHLNNAQGVTLSGGTSTISMLVNCNAPITVGTGTAASCTAAALSDAIARAPAPPLSAKLVFDCGSAPHTITTGELVLTKNLTIDGGDKVTLSGGNANRVVHVGPGVTVELKNCTIADGIAHLGGGVLNDAGGTLLIKDCLVRNNTATDTILGPGEPRGGGVLNFGTMTIENSTVRDNTAVGGPTNTGRGGGVGHGFNAVTTIKNSTITQNTATQSPAGNNGGAGGGMWAFSGNVLVLDSTLSKNTARFGGGVLNNVATFTIKTSDFLNNTATTTGTTNTLAGGGGVSNSGPMTIENSTFNQNVVTGSVTGRGGAIEDAPGGNVTVRNSTLNQNTATGGTNGRGGAIRTTTSSTLLVEDSFITNNTATGGTLSEGGGIAKQLMGAGPGSATIKNTSITGNTATAATTTTQGGGVASTCPLPTLTGTTSVTVNTPDNIFPASCP